MLDPPSPPLRQALHPACTSSLLEHSIIQENLYRFGSLWPSKWRNRYVKGRTPHASLRRDGIKPFYVRIVVMRMGNASSSDRPQPPPRVRSSSRRCGESWLAKTSTAFEQASAECARQSPAPSLEIVACGCDSIPGVLSHNHTLLMQGINQSSSQQVVRIPARRDGKAWKDHRCVKLVHYLEVDPRALKSAAISLSPSLQRPSDANDATQIYMVQTLRSSHDVCELIGLNLIQSVVVGAGFPTLGALGEFPT